MKKRNKPVIPGFGLSMGITISILSLVVLIPLASLVIYTAKLSFRDFIETITRARVLASFYTSFISAFAAAVINGIMGTILAWVLVRYEFPGKRIMDGMIELPFALPTAVAGIALTSLTSDSRPGRQLLCQIWYQDRIHKDRHHSCHDLRRNPVCCKKCTAGSGENGQLLQRSSRSTGSKEIHNLLESYFPGTETCDLCRNRTCFWQMPG